jgi:hypothetical protein
MVSSEDPFPGDGIVAGLKDAVSPAGSPEADSEISEAKDPINALAIVVVPGVPGTTANAAGDAESEKSGFEPWLTAKTTTLPLVLPPPEPVIVRV